MKNKFEELVPIFIEREVLTVEIIQQEQSVSKQLAKKLYHEWKNYNDEFFWHRALYEMSYLEDNLTPERVMNELNVSKYVANKLIEYYLCDEDILSKDFAKGLKRYLLPLTETDFAYSLLKKAGVCKAFENIRDDDLNYVASFLYTYPHVFYFKLLKSKYNIVPLKRVKKYPEGAKELMWEYHKYFLHQYVGAFMFIGEKFICNKMDITAGDMNEKLIYPTNTRLGIIDEDDLPDNKEEMKVLGGDVVYNNKHNEFLISVEEELFKDKRKIEEVKKEFRIVGKNVRVVEIKNEIELDDPSTINKNS